MGRAFNGVWVDDRRVRDAREHAAGGIELDALRVTTDRDLAGFPGVLLGGSRAQGVAPRSAASGSSASSSAGASAGSGPAA